MKVFDTTEQIDLYFMEFILIRGLKHDDDIPDSVEITPRLYKELRERIIYTSRRSGKSDTSILNLGTNYIIYNTHIKQIILKVAKYAETPLWKTMNEKGLTNG